MQKHERILIDIGNLIDRRAPEAASSSPDTNILKETSGSINRFLDELEDIFKDIENKIPPEYFEKVSDKLMGFSKSVGLDSELGMRMAEMGLKFNKKQQ